MDWSANRREAFVAVNDQGFLSREGKVSGAMAANLAANRAQQGDEAK